MGMPGSGAWCGGEHTSEQRPKGAAAEDWPRLNEALPCGIGADEVQDLGLAKPLVLFDLHRVIVGKQHDSSFRLIVFWLIVRT